MKKLISKLLTTLITMTMAFTMAVPTFAASSNATLTISSKQNGAEYSVYQVMSAEKISDNLYTYKVNDNFNKAFPLTVDSKTYVLNKNNEICLQNGDKETQITGDGNTSYDKTTYNTSSDVALVAAALESYAKKNSISPTATVTMDSSGSQSVSLPIGYYVIKQTKVPEKDAQNGYIASKAVLVNLTANKTVTVKDDTEKLDKTITGVNTDTSKNLEENTANIGDKINYKVTTYIPTYGNDVDKSSLKFNLSDTFSSGITFNNDVKVYISATEGDTSASNLVDTSKYTYTSTTSTFKVSLNPSTISGNQGKYVTLVYSGTLNADAKVNSSDGNPNTVKLDYTNGPDMNEFHLTDKVTTYTFGLGIKKVDKASGNPLDGAKFQLTQNGNVVKLVKISDDEYRVATSSDTNTVEEIEVKSASGHNPVIKGLAEGTYVLHETVAPDNYSKVTDITVKVTAKTDAENKLTGAADISVSGGKTQQGSDAADEQVKTTATNGTIDINIYVEDTKGISLPETGGKTAMYCLLGGALLIVMGGAYIGITNRKKSI